MNIGKSKKKNIKKDKVSELSKPIREALQAHLRHKYPRDNDIKQLAKSIGRPLSTVKGFIYNGIGGGQLQQALFVTSIGLKSGKDVEKFLNDIHFLYSGQSENLAPSVEIFYQLFKKTDPELLYFFMQSVALNIELANDFGINPSKN